MLSKTIIPNEYEILNYIDTGTKNDYSVAGQIRYDLPYINTGIKTTDNIRIVIKTLLHERANTSYGYNYAGGYSPKNDPRGSKSLIIGTNRTTFYLYYPQENPDNSDFVFNKRINYEEIITLDLDFGKGIFKCTLESGDTETNYRKPSKGMSNRDFTIIYLTPLLPPLCRLYEVKLYYGNEIKCHLIPTRRKSDSMIGMYDVVRNKFFISPNEMKFKGG